MHGSSLLYVNHSAPNGSFVHPPYGSVRLLDHVRHTAATLCLHTLRGPVVPRTLGVRFSECVWQFTALCGPLHCKQHFRTPFLRICMDRVHHTVATNCLYILGVPVVPRRLGVRIRDHVWTTPLQTAFSYTLSTDLYGSLTAYAIQLLQTAF